MTHCITPVLAALALAPLLAAGLLSPASAQEAIMLETIGAVRMVAPNEVRRRTDDDARRQRPVSQPDSTAQRHAAID